MKRSFRKVPNEGQSIFGKKSRPRLGWGRSSVAVLMGLFYLFSALPTVGHRVFDFGTTPPTARIDGRLSDGLLAIFVAVLPLICIFLRGRHWPIARMVVGVIRGFPMSYGKTIDQIFASVAKQSRLERSQ